MNNVNAIARIKWAAAMQRKGEHLPCPRCGLDRMDRKVSRNALSRYADVYICDCCGLQEAMRDFCGQEPLPPAEWGVALSSQ